MAAPEPYLFGSDPRPGQRYSLRQSRYDALAQDVSQWAGAAAQAGRPLQVLIVGCAAGNELRHLLAKPHFDNIVLSGANADDNYLARFSREPYRDIFIGDLMAGYPEIPSDAYDVVICEQVLEHLPRLPLAIATLARVLKPGGRLVVGVPIFPPPLHLTRRHLVPKLDALMKRRRQRGHVQAFSLRSFLAEMRRHSPLRLVKARGFRIISGGPLRPLEDRHWWWKLNRRLGELLPAACIEVQAIMEKPQA
jgi:SAM-dependent methyltransferase